MTTETTTPVRKRRVTYKIVATGDGEIIKREQTLPQNVVDIFKDLDEVKFKMGTKTKKRNQYIVALRNAGWTDSAIANAVNLSRERVRQLAQQTLDEPTLISDLPIPTPPRKQKFSKVYPELPKEMLDRLLELKPLAQQVRGHGKQYRAEADEYTYLLNEAITTHNMSVYRLAKLIGVTIGAIQFRLTRYGYRTSTGKSKCFQPILEKNRHG